MLHAEVPQLCQSGWINLSKQPPLRHVAYPASDPSGYRCLVSAGWDRRGKRHFPSPEAFTAQLTLLHPREVPVQEAQAPNLPPWCQSWLASGNGVHAHRLPAVPCCAQHRGCVWAVRGWERRWELLLHGQALRLMGLQHGREETHLGDWGKAAQSKRS